MKPFSIFFSLALLGLVLIGCDSNDDDDPDLPSFQVFNEADYTVTESGLRYIDFVEGDTTRAPAAVGDTIVVHYSGWLEDGFMFDSSVWFAQRPFTFPLRAATPVLAGVIDGWVEGVAGMYPMQQRQLIIPPSLAYGSTGTGRIPPNATLIFEVQYIGLLSDQQ